MLVSDFDFDLPPELIAQEPPAVRGSSRMLVVRRDRGTFHDDLFQNFPRYVLPGDCIVLNKTKVFPARLHGRRNHKDGAVIEVFLHRTRPEPDTWTALVRPAKRAQPGDWILFDEHLRAEIVASGEFGERTLRFESAEPLAEVFERIGSIPLPPYIRREPSGSDRERYQTIWAANRGSVAAPTAGLHFTTEILDRCREAGATVAFVTLHVGLGTFAPLREKEVSQIRLHEEYFQVEAQEARALQEARRMLCVGTTTTRTVESAMLRGGLSAMDGETNLFISPGFSFRAAGALLTNFHLPQSSLLLLVSAFASKDLVLRAYAHAVRERYRFFSYGDCMLIL